MPITKTNDVQVVELNNNVEKPVQIVPGTPITPEVPLVNTTPIIPETPPITPPQEIDHSWDVDAAVAADAELAISTMTAEQKALAASQEFEANKQTAITNFYGSKYSSEQKANNWGWTGGALLDESIRLDYMKAGINAQLYNSKELMLAGFNTELAIAKEYAALKENELANQYYNEAWTRSIQESEITGYFIAPEAQEMFDQYSMATSILNDPTQSGEAVENAQRILNTAIDWARAEFGDDDDSLIQKDLESWNNFMTDYRERNATMTQRSMDMAEAAALREREIAQGLDIDADGLIGDSNAFTNVQEDSDTGELFVRSGDGTKYQVEETEAGGTRYVLDENGDRVIIKMSDTEQGSYDFINDYGMPEGASFEDIEAIIVQGTGVRQEDGTVIVDYGDGYTFTAEQAEALGLTITDIADEVVYDGITSIADEGFDPDVIGSVERGREELIAEVVAAFPTEQDRHRSILTAFFDNNADESGDITHLIETAQKYISGYMTPAEYATMMEGNSAANQSSYLDYAVMNGNIIWDSSGKTWRPVSEEGNTLVIDKYGSLHVEKNNEMKTYGEIMQNVFGVEFGDTNTQWTITADDLTDNLLAAMAMAWKIYSNDEVTNYSTLASDPRLAWYFNGLPKVDNTVGGLDHY